jgi:hypothetical protein
MSDEVLQCHGRHTWGGPRRTRGARSLYIDTGATLDDLSEAVETLVDTERIARRVLGGAHPDTEAIEDHLRIARAVLRAREETQPPPGGA